jgi:DNA-binding GntR family transcriptional regulator
MLGAGGGLGAASRETLLRSFARIATDYTERPRAGPAPPERPLDGRVERYDRGMSAERTEPTIESLQPAIESLQPAPTIVEQVYRAILDAICDGRLPPGERLTQESVAQKLAVSRQPVGQALALLKQRKFVSEAGRRGLMVAPLDRDLMRAIYELRLGIEPLAATLAARNASADDVARGERMMAAGKDAVRRGSIADLIDADMRFHLLVYELSGNALFVDVMTDLWNHLRRAMREVLQHREYRRAIWVEHGEILRAIARRDGEAAAALTRAHLEHAAVNVQIDLPAAPAGASA